MTARLGIFLFLILFKLSKGLSSSYETTIYDSYGSSYFLEFYRVFQSQALEIKGLNNVFVCMTVCTKLNECRSFYLESGACVFGVTQIVNGIENTHLTTVKPKQKIFVKGNRYAFLC